VNKLRRVWFKFAGTPVLGFGRGLVCGFVYRCWSGRRLSPADVASL